MPEADRRVVLLPSGTSEESASKLAAALRAAVDGQRRLAEKSNYILHLTGEVRRTPAGFEIPHEPAEGLPQDALYEPAAAKADAEQLLQIAAALFEALRTAHAGDGGRALTHGGLCPGTLLRDENGQYKVSDFGFAQAVCQALGEDSYANLAIGPPRDGGQAAASACWEVLSADEYGRDDRLYAFIDIEKYATRMLRSFESASDIFSAGVVLHVLAEHAHPFIPESDWPRVPAYAELMGAGVVAISRRKELSQSSQAGVKLWCELVEKMLEQLPRARPAASELATRFEPYIPKIDFNRVKAVRWVTGLERTLAGGDLDALLAEYEARPEVDPLPAEVQQRLKPIEAKLNAVKAERRRVAAIAADQAAAEAWFQQFEGCVNAEQWEAAETAWTRRPQLGHFPDTVLRAAEALLEKVRAARAEQARREKIASDQAVAHKWFKSLEQAVGAGDWKAADKLLRGRPTLEHWPADASEEAIAQHEQRVREQLDRMAAEERAREADLRAAREWLAGARAMFDRGELDAAQDALHARPTLNYWPQSVQDEAAELDASIRSRLADEADREIRAREERAKRLGQNFVVRVVAAQLGKFVDPGMVQTRVTSIEFTPGDPAGDGRAQLGAALATVADTERGAGLRSGFIFRLAPDPGTVRDEDGALRDWLVRGLSERLTALQRSKLSEVSATLHGELFPKAEVTCELTGLSERVKATVHLLGRNQAAGDVETELRWDAKALAWTHADAAAFAQKAVNLVTAVTKKLAATKLIDQSESLKPYKPVIAVDVALAEKPAPGVIPRALQLEGRLSLKPGSNGEPKVLQTIGLKCAKVGSLSLDGDLKPAEAALRELVIAAQNKSRQALSDDLDQRIKAAGVRVRATALPKRITEPAPEVAFELKPRAGAQVKLTAAWDASAFAYAAPQTWEAELAPLLAAPTTGGGGGGGGGGGTRAFIIGGAAAVVVLVGGVIAYIAMNGGANGKHNANQSEPNQNSGVVTNVNDNAGVVANDNGPANDNDEVTNDNGPPPANDNVPPPTPIDLVAVRLAATASEAAVNLELSYEIKGPEGAGVPAHQVRFYRDADGDSTLDPAKDEALTQPVELSSGAAGLRARTSIPLAAARPEAEEWTLFGMLSATDDPDEPVDNNVQSTVVNIPARVETPISVDLIAKSLNVTTDADALIATFEYEVRHSRGAEAPPFRVRIFWDTNGDNAFTPGEDAIVDEAGNRAAGTHTASGRTPLSSGHALTADESVVAELIAADWPLAEADPANNRSDPFRVAARRPEPGDLVADLRAAYAELGPNATPGTAALIGLLAPPAGESAEQAAAREFVAAVASTVKVGRLEQVENGVRVELNVSLKGAAGDLQPRFLMERVAGSWQAAAANAAGLTELQSAARQALEARLLAGAAEVAQKSAAGQLAAAWEAAKPLGEIVEPMGETEGTARLARTLAALPLAFESAKAALGDYRPTGSTDEATGYPTQLTDKTGRVLLLVALPPTDSGGWSLYYIDAREWASTPGAAGEPIDDMATARATAAGLGRAVPTLAEWTAAATRLRSEAAAENFAGGLWEWCESGNENEPLVTGGCTLSLELAPLPAAATAEQFNAWLRDPLITQKRVFGDGLVGLRSVLRVHTPTGPQ